MDELTRTERIDRRANWMLRQPNETRPAAWVWDEATKYVDANMADEAAGLRDNPASEHDLIEGFGV